MKTLLGKLESIRRELRSDKVFDVIGRLFEGVSMKDYLDQTVEGGDSEVIRRLEGTLTHEQVLALRDKERALYCKAVRSVEIWSASRTRRSGRPTGGSSPGYVRRFVEKAVPLLDLRIEGDLDATFTLSR